MKRFLILFALSFFFIHAYPQKKNGFAKTPPMGWNSYNCFGATVTEAEIKENADYQAKHLKKHGWEYVVIDFCWSYPHHPKSSQDNPGQMRLPKDQSYQPWLSMDKFGRLLPYLGKFPSAENGRGFKPIGDYIHGLGLKFGIHVMRGIPRQAVWEKSDILGTNGITADMIADTTSTCSWLDNMYGLDMSKPGAQEYINSLLDLYAGWGVDFIKVDDIAEPYYSKEIEAYAQAIKRTNRPIVLSLSPGETPVGSFDHLKEYANMWRVSADFWDNWRQLKRMFHLAASWNGKSGPGSWPDCDMLQIGSLSKRGPVGSPRKSRFTIDEMYSHISLWSIFKSPLFIGGNLPDNKDFETSLLTNDEIIAVNQKSEFPILCESKQEDIVIWRSKQSTNTYNIAVFNLSEEEQCVKLNIKDLLGIGGLFRVRDLWKKQDVEKAASKIERTLNPHACYFFQVSK
jgi:alpha-galactosidase